MAGETIIRRLTSLRSQGITLGSGGRHWVSVHAARIHVLEVDDVFFRHDSAVMMPDAGEDTSGTTDDEDRITGLAVLKTVFIRLREFPDQRMLIAGHTDTSGNEAYNVELSELRARSVLHLLQGGAEDREAWVEIAREKHKVEDIEQILKWAAADRGWDCDPGAIDGRMDATTREAVLNFQKEYNVHYRSGEGAEEPIDEDGLVGRQTWGAFFDLYQSELADLHDTGLEGLTAYRSALRWLDNAHKAVGCGESWPVEAAEQNNYRSERNRRVEILFFDPEEDLTLDCHPEEGVCEKEACPLYPPHPGSRIYLPVHPHPRPQALPRFYTIEQPGATNHVRMHSLVAYAAHFNETTGALQRVRRYRIDAGRLCGFHTGTPLSLDCERDTWFYFSHRDDLLSLDRKRYFKQDGSGLPLLGPIQVPCGQDVRVELDIWQQNDWVVVRGPRLDGERPDHVRMAEWRDDYTIGWAATLTSGQPGFVPYGDQREKDRQERWKLGGPIDLVHLGNPRNDPMWAGTLSALPSDKAKILLLHDAPSGGPLVVGSFQELEPTGANVDLPGHHVYDRELVRRLTALDAHDPDDADVDALPDPPARCLLGDMCWQDQGQTNNCGPYSFSTAMNYWYPHTNNPAEKDGALYAQAGNVDDLINGARTPGNIVNAARRFDMHGVDHDGEGLSRDRVLKLVKLWIVAGVPVLILVKEEFTLSSYHWKTVAGYDGNRFFLNNSGADNEIIVAQRTPGVPYEEAPVGNDVDSEAAFYTKWHGAGGDIVDFITSVDRCTFIPVYPKDEMFAGSAAR